MDKEITNVDDLEESPAGTHFQQKSSSILGGNFGSILEWLKTDENDNFNLNKIYRASEDGDTRLHECIDAKGPTVMVISANGRIFGGYTSLDWNTDGSFRTDTKSFLFSVTDNYKLPVDQSKNYWAIYAVKNSYTYFGYPTDLIIQNNFLTSTTNASNNSGGTYPNNNGVYLAGELNFKIDELEVFTVEKV